MAKLRKQAVIVKEPMGNPGEYKCITDVKWWFDTHYMEERVSLTLLAYSGTVSVVDARYVSLKEGQKT